MKNIYILLIFLIPEIIFGQKVTVSEPLSIRNDYGYEVIGKMKDRFLLFRDKSNNNYEIQAFHENLHQSWSKNLDFEKKRTDVLRIIPNDEFFNIIYQYKDKGKSILRTTKYDAGANEIDTATIFNYGNRFYAPQVDIVYSEDKSKILLYSIERQTKIEVICFDINEMKLLWNNEFTPEGLAFYTDFQQPLLTNKGEMYFIMGKDNRKSTREKHLYEIYYADADSPFDGISFTKVSMQEQLTFDVLFNFDNLNNNIVAAGLYSDKNRGKANGYFFLKIPAKNTENYKLSFKVFDDQFVSGFLGKIVDDNKGIPETIVKEIILRRDGGIIMIAERYKQFERSMTNVTRGGYVGADGRAYIVDYHIEDIMAVSIHPNGKTHWEAVLPKRQYSQDDDAVFSSFFLLKTPTSLRLLFNDEIKYENTVSEYVISANGEFNRKSVMSTFNQKLQLRFRDAVQVAANELVIPSERRSKLRLVKVEY